MFTSAFRIYQSVGLSIKNVSFFNNNIYDASQIIYSSILGTSLYFEDVYNINSTFLNISYCMSDYTAAGMIIIYTNSKNFINFETIVNIENSIFSYNKVYYFDVAVYGGGVIFVNSMINADIFFMNVSFQVIV